ncbi:cobalamin B12-binding domain-containing protein [Streptomyces luteogriseus]|uniref:cobalamin B12-binding domain-containing protein n=1 Tax=Streptomyces luteogriseus TaxID=68233 RepID=UPI00380C3439
MRILLSTVSSDSHTWNLVFLQLLLEESGHEVVNLGPCVPDQLLVETARQECPDAIVISSVNGHGHLDGARLIRAVRADRDVRHIPALIGGKLGIRGNDNIEYARGLKDAGFDEVFTEGSDPERLGDWLAALPVGAAPQLLGAEVGQ